jgi:hypothetical protein
MSMADKKRNPDQVLLRTKRDALLGLIPPHLRGIELRMMPVFFDRRAIIVPKEVVRMLSRYMRVPRSALGMN